MTISSTSYYKELGTQPLDLSKFCRTLRCKSALLKLFSNDSVRILYCPLREWGARPRKPKLYGTKMVSVDKTRIYDFSHEHGSTLRILFEAGLVQIDRDTPTPETRTLLFRLSDAVLEQRREVYRDIFLKDRRRVIMDELQALASCYGLAVEHNPLYGLFRVIRNDGTRICKKDYVIQNPNTGYPVLKQNNLTLLEWDDVFHTFHQRDLKIQARMARRKKLHAKRAQQ